jgi:spore coat protein U-like protein
MKIRHQLIAFVLTGILGLAQSAHAVISCNISSPGFFAVYDSTVALPTDSTSSVTINCSRALADAASQAYTLSADNGLNPTGQTNRSILSTFIKYDEYQDAAYSLQWGSAPPAKNAFSGTINFGSGTTASVTIPFYNRIPAAQAAAAGNYTDIVTMTLVYGIATALATHTVLISTIPQCQISTPPGNIVFAYTAFQPAAALASTTFAARCTTALPYSMSLDADTPMLNLTYSLVLPITTGTGTGLPQTYTISGTIPASQPGTCAAATCTATAARNLTITF